MSDQVHILCARHLSDEQLARIKAVSPRVVVQHRDVNESTEQLEAELTPETEIVFGFWEPFDLKRAPNLRWVQVESAGVNQLQNTPLWHSDITITSANGVHAVQIPEHVMAVLLSYSRRLPHFQRLQEQARWGKHGDVMTLEVRGSTIGVVGYGAIGREVARLAATFGMRVLATKRIDSSPKFEGWTPNGTGDLDGSIPAQYYPLDELKELLGQSDFVVLSLPMTDDTRHIIGAAELAAMRPEALLINIGRGALVDQAALIDALRDKHIGGAALDVTDPEPLPPDSPLWSMDNVMITPHVSGNSPNYNERSTELFAENLRRYLAGESLLNEVQRDLGY